MSTTITTTRPPTRRSRRRAFLSVAVVAGLAVGGGVAAVSLTSSDGAAGDQAKPATTVVTDQDARSLWDELATLPASERDVIVAGLSADMRARLRATAEEIAIAAEHH